MTSRRGMRAGVAQGGLISPVLFSLYVNDMPPPLYHVELALYADDTAIITTSRKPTLLVSYLESYLNDLQRWMSEWRIAINVSMSTAIIFARAGRRFIQPRPVSLFGEPIEWVDTTRYLGVTLNIRLTWLPHIDQVRKRTAQRMGMLGPVLKRKSDLSFRNGVLLYKQLIRPLMDYACPAWKPAAHSHVRKLQVLQSKCLRLAIGAPWYVSNRQLNEDLRVPLFADHIRALTESFDSKLADVLNPLVRQLGRYLRWPRVDPVAWSESQGRQGTAGQPRPSPAMAKATKPIAFGAEQPSAIRLPWLRFSAIFLSCKANAWVFGEMSGHGPRSLPQARRLHLSAWQTSHNSSMRQSQSGLGTETANQPKFIPPILSPGQPRP